MTPSSRWGYCNDLARWLEWCDNRNLDPLGVGRFDVAAYRDELLTGRAMSTGRRAAPTTVSRRVSVVKHLFDWLLFAGLVSTNPARPLKLPKIDPRRNVARADYASDAERRAVLVAMRKHASEGNLSRRDAGIMLVLAYCGPRASEISGLTVDCLGKGTLRYVGKGGVPRTVELPSFVEEIIREYVAERARGIGSQWLPANVPLFVTSSGRAVEPRQLCKIVDRACRWAGIRTLSPHAWRHGLITSARLRGQSREQVQAFIGHAKPETTALYEHGTAPSVSDVGLRMAEQDMIDDLEESA